MVASALAVWLLVGAEPISACPVGALRPGLHDRQLSSANALRSYHLYVPKAPMPKGGFPLVVSFHAAASSAAGHAATTHLREKAEEAGFVIAEPEGFSGNFSKRSWNAGTCCGAAADAKVDDVTFVRDLVNKVKSDEACIDLSRVYATGHGNGGMFVHRLACEASDLFAAVASVSGAIATSTCTPTDPIAVLEIHGTADGCHPMQGGKGKGLDAVNTKRSVKETMEEWRVREKCSEKTRTVRKIGPLTCRTFDKCQPLADVMLCEVQGQGHGWPGSDKYEMQTLCGGSQVPGVSANDVVWSFFSAHHR